MTGSWLARLRRRGKILFGGPDPAAEAAADLYDRAVRQARLPVFYTSMGVPDTHDGRLELVQLHVILLLRRLQRGDEPARAIGQALFDAMFKDIDRSLREGGVGDLSVGSWVKKIAQQFYARATAVETALERQDEAALAEALAANVFGPTTPLAQAGPLAAYLLAEDAALGEAAAVGSDPRQALRFRPVEAIHPRPVSTGMPSTAG